MKMPLSELDVIFISYDEPNADENWADLLNKCPWAKRSHGVYGSDAAHKAAAQLSDTDRFIGIDGDNIIDPNIFNLEFDESVINGNRVLSWKGKNIVNGLVYGNGGIKSWPVDIVMNMKTHEISETEKGKIEFCWDLNYLQMDQIFSTVYNNASPYQSFRAGFREGCKMSLEQGEKLSKEEFADKIYPDNFKRLKTWMSIGSHVENGLWCIYGARLGFWMTNLTDWDYVNVRDFKQLDLIWEEYSKNFIGNDYSCPRTGFSWNKTKLVHESRRLGNIIEKEYDFFVPIFTKHESNFLVDLI